MAIYAMYTNSTLLMDSLFDDPNVRSLCLYTIHIYYVLWHD